MKTSYPRVSDDYVADLSKLAEAVLDFSELRGDGSEDALRVVLDLRDARELLERAEAAVVMLATEPPTEETLRKFDEVTAEILARRGVTPAELSAKLKAKGAASAV